MTENLRTLVASGDVCGLAALWQKEGPSLLKVQDEDERCFWHWVASNDSAALFDYVWDRRDESMLPLDHKDEEGWTALHVAAATGSENIAGRLIRNGANPEIPLKNGNTPLHLAAGKGSTRICEVLLNISKSPTASLSLRNSFGHTPLARAVTSNRLSTAEALVNHGAVLSEVLAGGNNLLHEAVIDRSLDMIRFILTQAPDLALAENGEGRDPLSYGDGTVRAVFAEFFDEREK